MQDNFRGSLMSAEEAHLTELHKWLTYELATFPFAILLFVMPGFLFMIAVYAAILFTPYMIWRLAQCQRYGWITAFVILVGLPFAIRFVFESGMTANFILTWLPLAMFYLYTFTLRHSVTGWIEELKWKRHNKRIAAGSRDW